MSHSDERNSVTATHLVPPLESTCPSDSESEFARELETKRRTINEEISHFQTTKEKEFRDFEEALKSNRRRKRREEKDTRYNPDQESSPQQSKRNSSSALNLLAGRGAAQQFSKCGPAAPSSQDNHAHNNKDSLSFKTGPSPSKPTLSVDPQNIRGETLSTPTSNGVSSPTSLPRTLSQTSLNSLKNGLSSPKSPTASPAAKSKKGMKAAKDLRDSFVGILTPSYLPLLDSKYNGPSNASSALITPPPDENGPVPTGDLLVQSSSFPPHVTVLSPAATATKRAYTAPAGTPMPSALRSASVTNLAKKRKHVTFRLADSAIVDPSSSYEEGPSPIEDGVNHPRSKSTTAVSHSSRKASSLRHSNVSPRNGLISDHTRSDEEDEAAGVKPGMSMDEVMQKLNAHLNLDDDEDVGWTDTKYHEEDDDDDDDDVEDEDTDTPHNNGSSEQDTTDTSDDDSDGQYGDDHPKNDEADSYFSPKFHEMSTVPNAQFDMHSRSQGVRDRSGSSPLTPLRDQNWDALSSSDKDRLLFAGRASDSDSDHRQPSPTSRNKSKPVDGKLSPRGSTFGGLKKTSSMNSFSSLTSLGKLGSAHKKMSSSIRSDSSRSSVPPRKQPKFEDGLGPSVDGGSNIGFFELDEELTSPNARKVQPFAIDTDVDVDEDEDDSDADVAMKSPTRSPGAEAVSSAILGTAMASVPINIVRPSTSVSSSWVGTFGH